MITITIFFFSLQLEVIQKRMSMYVYVERYMGKVLFLDLLFTRLCSHTSCCCCLDGEIYLVTGRVIKLK